MNWVVFAPQNFISSIYNIELRCNLSFATEEAQIHDISTSLSCSLASRGRDYGEYTGKNKWEVKDLVGEEAFNQIRRGWDVPVPGGETLKMVYERVVPFYSETILPQLREGKNILIVASGNSIRSLMKYLESISDEGISQLEMPFGQIIVYNITAEGLKASSSSVQIDITPPNA